MNVTYCNVKIKINKILHFKWNIGTVYVFCLHFFCVCVCSLIFFYDGHLDGQQVQPIQVHVFLDTPTLVSTSGEEEGQRATTLISSPISIHSDFENMVLA